MAWGRKKLIVKMLQYFENKNIVYTYEEDKALIQVELYFKGKEYMLYPYITMDDSLCSININIAEHTLKGFSYERMNQFNQESKFFKAYISSMGIIVLEYRFIFQEMDSFVLDTLLDSLFALESEIDGL
ncbi:MAG: YbjN domain-containing protein [Anaeroplasmataceae bacterium]|nr:YbjN domain-containing protein [Anaeroplasmataceae bacterium]